MEKKPWYLSKTLWGAAISGVVGVAAAAGHPISPALVEGGSALLDIGLALAGSGLAAYGRATAATAIGA